MYGLDDGVTNKGHIRTFYQNNWKPDSLALAVDTIIYPYHYWHSTILARPMVPQLTPSDSLYGIDY